MLRRTVSWCVKEENDIHLLKILVAFYSVSLAYAEYLV